ncbi:MAG: putative lipid II flippase FtsW [Actinobacteria bacterium]|nr:putative lipid II flippase FtsW [Actinomycetota bacterium]
MTPARRTSPELRMVAVCAGSLFVLGMVMTFSASFVSSTAETGDPFGIVTRHALWCALAVPAGYAASRVQPRTWRRMALPLLAFALLAALLVLVPNLGVSANGSRRWFDIGPVTFQPSEVVKLGVALWSAHILARAWPRLRAGDVRSLLVPVAPMLFAAVVLVAASPDLETAFIVAVAGGVPLFLAGLPLRLVAGGALLGGLGMWSEIVGREYRQARIEAWFDPLAYYDTIGYQTSQGFFALASGGWFGVGLGQGRGKWLYVPNAHTDFIFAIIGEELGLVGGLTVIALFTALGVAGVRITRRAADPFGRLLAGAITGWIMVQAFTNVGSVVGLLPVTGVTLPLVSFGGSSLFVTAVAIGMLAGVARSLAPPGDGEDGPPRQLRLVGSEEMAG